MCSRRTEKLIRLYVFGLLVLSVLQYKYEDKYYMSQYPFWVK